MNPKLHAKLLTMAAATLGLGLVGGCAKKSEPAATEGGQAAAGAEHACGAGSCGAAHKDEKKSGVEGTGPGAEPGAPSTSGASTSGAVESGSTPSGGTQ